MSTTIAADLNNAERSLSELMKRAASPDLRGLSTEKKAGRLAPLVQRLVEAASKIRSPRESRLASEDLAKVDVPDVADKFAYDIYRENSDRAAEILATASETLGKIDELKTAGRRFDAQRARDDVQAVITRVAGIMEDVDLTSPWVRSDLEKLANRTNYLHGLFIQNKSARS